VCESELASLRQATSPVIGLSRSGRHLRVASTAVTRTRCTAATRARRHRPRHRGLRLLGRAAPRAVLSEDEAPLTQIRLAVLLALLLAGAVAALVLRLAAPAKC